MYKKRYEIVWWLLLAKFANGADFCICAFFMHIFYVEAHWICELWAQNSCVYARYTSSESYIACGDILVMIFTNNANFCICAFSVCIFM